LYDSLFEPIAIGPVEIPNRIVRAAHGTSLPWVDQSDELIAYHEARARGGAGLLVLEHGGVHPGSTTQGNTIQDFAFYDEAIVDGCQRIADAVHQHGTKLFLQASHRGSSFKGPDGAAPWSASAVPNPVAAIVPVAMTKDMIDEVVEGFALAGYYAKMGGLDGVEIQAGHGYLLAQFLSPATNHRDDDYGGSLENRARLLSEIITAVRSRVGADFPIGIRISGDDDIVGGQRPHDTAKIVALVDDQIDFASVSLGSYYRFHRLIPTMEEPMAFEVPTSEPVTRVCTKPTMIAGRIMTLDVADNIVASGVADMVSIVRGLIADPDLIIKARDGREAEIRPCIGTSQGCVGRPLGRIACVVNPSAGNEAHPYQPGPAERPRKVMVVGGGPAGMEAARAAALRGHSVDVHEMRSKLGGQVNIAAAAPRRADFAAITRWQEDELKRLGVRVHLRSIVDDDFVRASDAEAVIISTGSTCRRDGFQAIRPVDPIKGFRLPHVYTSWDVFGFGGRAQIGSHAVVFDDTGRYDALSVAEALVEAGAAVTFVSSHDSLGAKLPWPVATAGAAREQLLAAPDFTFMPNAFIDRIETDCVYIGHGITDRLIRVQADTVVLVGYNEPEHGLADLLRNGSLEIHVIGEAAGKTSLREAIADGHAAGQAT
jgi:2,4-dienoyl-CoA reductase-like NADH-dependent reductase (Old Yellow Enzyme family)